MHADPTRAIFKGKALQYTEEKMARALWRAGASPYGLLDLRDMGDDHGVMRELLLDCDGLLLQGGSDVAPASYGETPLRPEWGGDPLRDHFETLAVEIALERRIPILGICRGVQILNVALGGTLYQDINTQIPDSLVHRDWERYEELEHEVRIDPGSWLHAIYDAESLLTNTVHHQAIKELAPDARATAWAEDGVIEAFESIHGERWAVGIQWHPEWLDGSELGGPDRSRGDSVFEAFVQLCVRRKAT
jgi:putative glutamine amidotransferase